MAKAGLAQTVERLTIRDVELIPLLAPLAQEYRGSYYRMANRATVVIRIRTDEGLVGEAYAGDEDETLARIVAVVRDEIVPRIVGEDAMAVERRVGLELASLVIDVDAAVGQHAVDVERQQANAPGALRGRAGPRLPRRSRSRARD